MPAKDLHPTVWRRLVRPMPLILIAGFLCLSGWFAFGSGGLWDSYSLRQRYARQQAHITELQARKEWLKTRLADLKDKKELALEHAARDYGLVAPGETVYEIKVDSTKP